MNLPINKLTKEQSAEIAKRLNTLIAGSPTTKELDEAFYIISEFVPPPLIIYYADAVRAAESEGYMCSCGSKAFAAGLLAASLHARFKEINELNELMKKGEENV